MSIVTIYTLNDARRITGENRNLITFLIQERGIPIRTVGMAKVLDSDGLKFLIEAIAEYRAKSSVQPAPATA